MVYEEIAGTAVILFVLAFLFRKMARLCRTFYPMYHHYKDTHPDFKPEKYKDEY